MVWSSRVSMKIKSMSSAPLVTDRWVARLEPGLDPRGRAGRQMQPELGAPPQHVGRALCPFRRRQIVELGMVEVAAEAFAEIGERGCPAENALGARAVGAGIAPG